MPSGISEGALFLLSVSSALSITNLNISIALQAAHKYFAFFHMFSFNGVGPDKKHYEV